MKINHENYICFKEAITLECKVKGSLNCNTFFNIQTFFDLILYGFKIITNKCEFYLEFQSPSLNLTHSNTEALFIFSYWFSDIFVHNFLEKWVFSRHFAFPTPSLLYSMSNFFFELLDRKHSLTQPSPINLEGEVRVYFELDGEERSHLESGLWSVFM